MVTLVRKFSISVEGYGEKVLPVLYIREYKEGEFHYCIAHPDTGEQLFIEMSKVTKIFMKQDEDG